MPKWGRLFSRGAQAPYKTEYVEQHLTECANRTCGANHRKLLLARRFLMINNRLCKICCSAGSLAPRNRLRRCAMVRDKTRTLASPPLPRLVGPSQGCKLHGAPIRTLVHAPGPLVWALGKFQPTANPPFAVRSRPLFACDAHFGRFEDAASCVVTP